MRLQHLISICSQHVVLLVISTCIDISSDSVMSSEVAFSSSYPPKMLTSYSASAAACLVTRITINTGV